ncbi:hypothetical protein I4A74_001875 [Enterobacter hormaechei]
MPQLLVYSAALTFIVALMRCFIMRKINEHT